MRIDQNIYHLSRKASPAVCRKAVFPRKLCRSLAFNYPHICAYFTSATFLSMQFVMCVECIHNSRSLSKMQFVGQSFESCIIVYRSARM